jgi:hypothetical protein
MKIYLCLPLLSEYVDKKTLVEHIKLNIYFFLSPKNTKMHFKFMPTNLYFKKKHIKRSKCSPYDTVTLKSRIKAASAKTAG